MMTDSELRVVIELLAVFGLLGLILAFVGAPIYFAYLTGCDEGLRRARDILQGHLDVGAQFGAQHVDIADAQIVWFPTREAARAYAREHKRVRLVIGKRFPGYDLVTVEVPRG